jgi:ascorbate-specific PTS system EIIC-type component UlaA
MTTVIGAILVLLGFGFFVRGLGGVFGILAAPAKDRSGLDPITKFIEAVTDLVEALTKAPKWLSATVIGILLVLLGAWIGGWLPPLPI